jgi:hypothetical protein
LSLGPGISNLLPIPLLLAIIRSCFSFHVIPIHALLFKILVTVEIRLIILIDVKVLFFRFLVRLLSEKSSS